jgi:hypothetical protein
MPFEKYQDRQLTWLRTRPWLGAWFAKEIDAVLGGGAVAATGEGTSKGGRPKLDEAALGPFSVRTTGNVGQVVLGPDGGVVAWTTDPWIAQVIAKLLCDNEHLLLVRCEPTTHHFV